MSTSSIINTYTTLNNDTLKRAYHLMCITREIDRLYEAQREVCDQYVHSTSRGHEAVQIAVGMLLRPYDYAAPYYRDEALLLAMGLSPYTLMLQLLAKQEDVFSGGRNYYIHPILKRDELPTIPYLGITAGSHVIPATGIAQGLAYLSAQNLRSDFDRPVVLCSLGDAALTNGEVAEALQIALLKRLPIIYLVQDNDWGRSARAEEYRAMDAYEFAGGIKGMKRMRVNGADFVQAYESIQLAIEYVRVERQPVFLHAKCPLIGHFSSALRTEQYRPNDNLVLHSKDDPIIRLGKYLIVEGVTEETLETIAADAKGLVAGEFDRAMAVHAPDPESVTLHAFASSSDGEEPTESVTSSGDPLQVAHAAAHAIGEILEAYPEAVYYGQDVGGMLGGLFGEARGLAGTYGEERVFNIPAQPAYAIGSTLGMTAVGCKPIVEVAADQLWMGLNQLVQGLSKSSYLSNGQFPTQVLIRVPTGAYRGSGPFQSASLESVLLQIPGIKVAYPSNAADLSGLLRTAFEDPNPVVVLEHRGLYLGAMPNVEAVAIPGTGHRVPLGKARIVQEANDEKRDEGATVAVITYGLGVYWAQTASLQFPGSVEILDLRTLHPLDWEAVLAAIKRHNKVLIVTEEAVHHSFAEALAGRISKECFKILDAPVLVCGAVAVPAIPLHVDLQKAVLPDAEKVAQLIEELLNY